LFKKKGDLRREHQKGDDGKGERYEFSGKNTVQGQGAVAGRSCSFNGGFTSLEKGE